MEGMTILTNDIKYSLLPSLGHKEAISTLGYPIASKLED